MPGQNSNNAGTPEAAGNPRDTTRGCPAAAPELRQLCILTEEWTATISSTRPEPPQRLCGRVVVNAEVPGDRRDSDAPLPQANGLRSDPLVHGHRHDSAELSLERKLGESTKPLRTCPPPISSLFSLTYRHHGCKSAHGEPSNHNEVHVERRTRNGRLVPPPRPQAHGEQQVPPDRAADS